MKDPRIGYVKRTHKSARLWKQASEVMPGGVTASIKYFEPYPVFMKRAKGARLFDVDGNEYIDYCLCLGPLILGHGHPAVVEAVKKQLDYAGTTIYGTPHELEIKMARKIRKCVTSIEKLRFVNSGLEATHHSIRVARAYTKRKKIAKFEGHYHGAHDDVAVSISPPLDLAGQDEAPTAVSNSAGLPESVLESTVVLPFNDLVATEKIVKEHKDDLAAVIIEPVARGFLPPEKDFLKGLRELTQENGIVLIFDEIMTGFRLALGGAVEYFGVIPDMVALGKIVGGGLPIGVFGGKSEIMEWVSPVGAKAPYERVFHSGTFNGCPTVLAAGLATIEMLEKPGTYAHINSVAQEVKKCMKDAFADRKITAQVIGLSSMWQCIFSSSEIKNYRDVASADVKKRKDFDLELINNGVFVTPGRTYYTSLAHTKADLEKTFEGVEKAAEAVSEV